MLDLCAFRSSAYCIALVALLHAIAVAWFSDFKLEATLQDLHSEISFETVLGIPRTGETHLIKDQFPSVVILSNSDENGQ